MTSVNWDDIAADADGGLPGFLGRMRALSESGKLRTFVAVFEEDDGQGGFGLTYWTNPEGTYLSFLGAAEYLKDALLHPQPESDD